MYQRLLQLRDHGRIEDGDCAGFSFNSRFDNLHAAILDLKFKGFPSYVERRRQIAAIYSRRLVDAPQVLLPPGPKVSSAYFDVYQNYEIEAESRDGLKEHLKKNGVETMVPWGGHAVHQFKRLGLSNHRLPRADKMLAKALMIPMHCELTDEQVNYVADCIVDFYIGK